MNDRLLREIRDRLTAIAAFLAMLVLAAWVALGIMLYWHLKADSARRRLLEDDRPPISSPVTRSASPSR